MAGEQAQQPYQGTGALTLDDAVDILTQPVTPARGNKSGSGGNGASQPADPQRLEADAPEDDEDQTDLPPDPEPDEQSRQEDDSDLDADPPADADKGPPTPSYTVQVDGKDITVPLSELLAGYQRQAAFTQRSQTLANERREFETHRDAVVKERGQYARLLVALEQQLRGEDEPDWAALEANDPVQFAVESARWTQRRERLAAIQSEKDRLSGEAEKQVRERVSAHVTEQARLLLEKVPEYRDEKVRLKDRTAIKDFAVSSYGFSADEIDQLVDHRAVLVLRDARAYRDLMAKRGVVEKRVVDAGAPLPRNRTGAMGVPQTRIRTADERLSRTGRLADAVTLELERSRARRQNGDGSGDR